MALGGLAVAKPLVRSAVNATIRAAAAWHVASIAGLNQLFLCRSPVNSWPVPLRVVKKTTDNCMEKFLTLTKMLADAAPLFTVDSVFTFATLKNFSAKA